jgi:hypothetical protein
MIHWPTTAVGKGITETARNSIQSIHLAHECEHRVVIHPNDADREEIHARSRETVVGRRVMTGLLVGLGNATGHAGRPPHRFSGLLDDVERCRLRWIEPSDGAPDGAADKARRR